MLSPLTLSSKHVFISILVAFAVIALGPLALAGPKKPQAATVVKAIKKARICLVLPKAQLGQGTNGTDVAEPVRQSLTTFLSGPATELIPLQARIPIQVDAEAQQLGCEYVLSTAVTQKKSKKGGGFGSMMGALGPLAGALPGLGGFGGGTGGMIAAQAAGAAAAAAQSAAMQDMQQQAMQQISGATQSNIKKGDQLTLEYTLTEIGQAQPLAVKSAVAKATDDGMDILSPLIEQAAIQVLTVINTPAAAPPAN